MFVFVINQHGEPLMPCKPRKARLLLKQKKAKIIKYQPFTIQLLYGSSGYTQDVQVGIDLGARHVGVALVSEGHVLAKGEVSLRQDVKSNLETRRIYRRSRRSRKTRYRKARFLNRTASKKKGWLPPSIQSRMDNTFRWVDMFTSLVPKPQLHLEVGKFDVQKMINPSVSGTDYQQGQAFSYHDVRYFVFARDNYTCQVCKQKNKILNTHHIVYRSKGGTDRADNLISVCTDCHTHENHQPGQVLWRWMQEGKKLPTYKATVFMHVIRKKVYERYPNARVTYGSETTPRRMALCLEKSHENDAIAITGVEELHSNPDTCFKVVQFRKKKRSLHEATARKGRKSKNVTSKRNQKNTKEQKGFYLNDKVSYQGQTAFISGFTGTTKAYLKDIEGNYVTDTSKSYKQIKLSDCHLICHQNNWQFICRYYVSHLRQTA